jgi:Ca2+-binding RTX toxin-like protein
VTNVNEVPTFNAAAANPIPIAENTSTGISVYNATATDPEGTNVIYTFGGVDAARFNFNPGTHLITFAQSPNFEAPLDGAGPGSIAGDNIYDVAITVSDGVLQQTQAVHIQVTDVLGVTINGTAAAEVINGTSSAAGQPFATPENDTIFGGGGADIISALDGPDIIDGGPGAQTMNGGLGNDTYFVDVGGPSGDVVNENAGEGIDLVHFTSPTAGASYTLTANVENLTLDGTADINGSGNNLANIITGNIGNNLIEGLAGNDTLDGGGNGAAGDTVSYANAGAAVTVNLTTGLATGGAGSDTVLNFENITGSIFNDTLTGNAGNNVIEGGAGNDNMDGGAGIDTVSYAHASAGVTVHMDTNAAQNTGGAGTDSGLLTFENATGSAFNDILTGFTGANVLNGGAGADLLKGNAGADTLIGGAGADTLTGGTGNDHFTYTAVTESGPAAAARDTITDFVHAQDLIDLSAIDANTTAAAPGDQAFAFVAAQNPAVVANSVTWSVSGGNTIVQADNTGDTVADFAIVLTGTGLGLTQQDFVL